MDDFSWKGKAAQAQKSVFEMFDITSKLSLIAERQIDAANDTEMVWRRKHDALQQDFNRVCEDKNYYRRSLDKHKVEDQQAIALLRLAIDLGDRKPKKTRKLITEALNILDPKPTTTDVPF